MMETLLMLPIFAAIYFISIAIILGLMEGGMDEKKEELRVLRAESERLKFAIAIMEREKRRR